MDSLLTVLPHVVASVHGRIIKLAFLVPDGKNRLVRTVGIVPPPLQGVVDSSARLGSLTLLSNSL